LTPPRFFQNTKKLSIKLDEFTILLLIFLENFKVNPSWDEMPWKTLLTINKIGVNIMKSGIPIFRNILFQFIFFASEKVYDFCAIKNIFCLK
jgi:hypothetical protein